MAAAASTLLSSARAAVLWVRPGTPASPGSRAARPRARSRSLDFSHSGRASLGPPTVQALPGDGSRHARIVGTAKFAMEKETRGPTLREQRAETRRLHSRQYRS